MDRDNTPEFQTAFTSLFQRSPAVVSGAESEREVLAGLLAYSKSTVSAQLLLQHFPSIGHVIAAEPVQLKTAGLTDWDIALLRLVQSTACHMVKAKVRERPTLNNVATLIAYLQLAMGCEQVEHLRVLFLDRKNRLIADEVLNCGTFDHTPVYPREVLKRALVLYAGGCVVVHNHPTGDPTPSRCDIEMTRQLKLPAAALDFELHDHIVIGHGKHASFRSPGLL